MFVPSRIRTFIFKQESNISTLSWHLLYEQLLKRVDKKHLFYNKEVLRIEKLDNSLMITFNDDDKMEYDFVFFCDGVNSRGRNFLFPEVYPKFSGYIAWRGIITSSSKKINLALKNKQELFTYENGLGFYYPIPSRFSNTLTLNTLVYEKVTENHFLHSLYKENNNKKLIEKFTLETYQSYYEQLVSNNFSEFPRKIFLKVKAPFIQPIRDLLLNRYFHDHCILIGDASTLLQPVTGSGAAQAIEDTLNVYEALLSEKNITVALNMWNKEKVEKMHHLYNLGKELGDFYVLSAKKWQSSNPEEIISKWKSITSTTDWYIKRGR